MLIEAGLIARSVHQDASSWTCRWRGPAPGTGARPRRRRPRRRPCGTRLAQAVPGVTGGSPLSRFLLETTVHPATQTIAEYREALAALESLPTAELERLFTETLDLCSHRLDAWITSLFAERLEEMREATPRGAHLGAYGRVENLRPAPAARRLPLPPDRRRALDGVAPALARLPLEQQIGTGGHVHAPSMTHAAAAAVLRSGYLSRHGAAAAALRDQPELGPRPAGGLAARRGPQRADARRRARLPVRARAARRPSAARARPLHRALPHPVPARGRQADRRRRRRARGGHRGAQRRRRARAAYRLARRSDRLGHAGPARAPVERAGGDRGRAPTRRRVARRARGPADRRVGLPARARLDDGGGGDARLSGPRRAPARSGDRRDAARRLLGASPRVPGAGRRPDRAAGLGRHRVESALARGALPGRLARHADRRPGARSLSRHVHGRRGAPRSCTSARCRSPTWRCGRSTCSRSSPRAMPPRSPCPGCRPAPPRCRSSTRASCGSCWGWPTPPPTPRSRSPTPRGIGTRCGASPRSPS